MNFRINCNCGRSILLTAAQAGTQQKCECGSLLEIPSLSVLRAQHQYEPSKKSGRVGGVVLNSVLLLAIALCIVFLPRSSELRFILAVTLFLGGKVWFVLLTFAEMGGNAVLLFLVPFLDWVFLVKRFDVAWKPVLTQLIGMLVGGFSLL